MVPYVSGLCANKLKKETKVDKEKKVLFCTVVGVLSLFALVLKSIKSMQRSKLNTRQAKVKYWV